jgi:hypothetical protein
MRRTSRYALIAGVAALVAVAGCEERAKSSAPPAEFPPLAPVVARDGGPDRITGVRLGELCHHVGTAACDRLATCSGIGADACYEVLMGQCCPDGRDAPPCTTATRFEPAAVDRCVRALGDQPCAERTHNITPDACVGLMAR